MHINIVFIVLTFIIMIAVILTADSLTTAMLIISLLTNFLVISSHFGKIGKNIGLTIQNAGKALTETTVAADNTHETEITTDVSEHEINNDYEEYNAYKTSYDDCYDTPKPVVGISCSERVNGIDAMNVLIAQRRARDKKCMDGAVLKDANYYKEHFGDEFKETEDRIWWSRNEY